MKKELAAMLAVGAAMSGNNLIMSGRGDEVDIFHISDPKRKREDIARIIEQSKNDQEAKRARRAARFEKGRK